MFSDLNRFENKPVMVLIVVATITGVLLASCGALVSDAGSDTIADYEWPFKEPEQALSQRMEPGEVPDGLSNGNWASIQTQIAAAKYHAYKLENDGFVSSNPAHRWQIHFGADGTTTLRPRDHQTRGYQLSLKLSAVGLQTLDRPEQINADDFTVTYQWNDYLREWWVNSATSLEQWFELEQRPPDAKSGQPLTLEMTLATDLASSQKGNMLSFVNAAGTTIRYSKLQAWDASGRALPARMQLAANTLNLIIDDSDASYPVTIDPSLEQQAYLKASNTDGDDCFGWSVAISGNTLVVAADGEKSNATGINGDQSDNSLGDAGAAYVFTRSGMTWSQQAYLKASNTDAGDRFGFSVALSGDTLVVGALSEASNATGINGDQSDNSVTTAGAAYVFVGPFTANGFTINAGHAGAWFNPVTPGQGQFIDVVPEEQFMFLSWFTFTDAASDNPNEQHWYTAQGNYSGDTAVLDLFETLDGKFDDPQEVTTTQVGEVTLTFSDCDRGMMSYSFDEEELVGEFPLIRVIPGSDHVCEGLSGNNPQAVDINAGMDGAWFDTNTPGQGFFIDAHPDPEGGNFIFVSWFTFGEDTASGQRWLTAQGGFEGSTAEIDVYETTGGSFDDPLLPNTVKAGTMNLDFTDCSNALLTYSLLDDGAEGSIAISRAIPGGQALCEELAGADWRIAGMGREPLLATIAAVISLLARKRS